ncbi:MAG: Mut7-C RNAse domain-containing protein [Gammaproteobacteria bacterium]|nr:Mut7-C RNAse domain-containing protein [Gammaproteobacteria bacterium]MCW8841268.1 Mut7-C RNAse domain-containing protein [Gammaproteobacteria bacterium]MCW8972211.1 Mut7-C RNAse domain-containing protein [Gammaproteobacteria bacterium]MCW8993918.1 Mut7-C RNAse domain-containing protein [Gammaproteobacteria bacterium]
MSRADRFLCDEMLQRAGRWLRAAGYDVVIAAAGESDAVLLQQARYQQRLLITRDRGMAVHPGAADTVVLLQGNTLHGLLREITERLAINWHYSPFSRCMECNTPLIEAPAGVIHRVPSESLRPGETLRYCPRCDKVYWEGSHVKRMRRQLARFARGEWDDE